MLEIFNVVNEKDMKKNKGREKSMDISIGKTGKEEGEKQHVFFVNKSDKILGLPPKKRLL